MRRDKGFIESVVAPLVIVATTAVGGWSVWVSMSSYDANKHIADYTTVTAELQMVADKLVEVEKSFITLHSDVTSSTGVNKRLLEKILQQVAP